MAASGFFFGLKDGTRRYELRPRLWALLSASYPDGATFNRLYDRCGMEEAKGKKVKEVVTKYLSERAFRSSR